VCGAAVSYDANGNTLDIDVDGPAVAGGIRSIAYDGENRPLSIFNGAYTTSFAYGPDGERLTKSTASKAFGYLGSGTELLIEGGAMDRH
jgi:hypothetical protein